MSIRPAMLFVRCLFLAPSCCFFVPVLLTCDERHSDEPGVGSEFAACDADDEEYDPRAVDEPFELHERVCIHRVRTRVRTLHHRRAVGRHALCVCQIPSSEGQAAESAL